MSVIDAYELPTYYLFWVYHLRSPMTVCAKCVRGDDHDVDSGSFCTTIRQTICPLPGGVDPFNSGLRRNEPRNLARHAAGGTRAVGCRSPALRSYRNGKATVFKTKVELLARYDTVFTPGVRCAIKSATPADVWGNWRGFTIGAGAIWWDRIIPNSAPSVQTSDLAKYPFGVFSVNHSSEADRNCAGDGERSKP